MLGSRIPRGDVAVPVRTGALVRVQQRNALLRRRTGVFLATTGMVLAACGPASPATPAGTGAGATGATSTGAASTGASATGATSTEASATAGGGTPSAVGSSGGEGACAGQPKVGGVAKIINEGGGTNPITQNEVLVWSIFDALLQQDVTGTLHPGIAETYDISSNGLTYTFHLNKNAKWSDGNPITADDVTFTYDKVMDPDITSVNRRWFVDVLKSWRAVDPSTVEFTLSRKASPILSYFAQQRIAPKSVFGSLSDQDVNTKFQQEAPVTSGPFKWVKTVPGQVVVTARNDAYYMARGSNDYRFVPYLDGIEFYPWGDPQANVLAMTSKTRDAHVLTMTRSEYDQLSNAPGLKVKVFPVGIYNYLELNNENALFSDVKVRQAMAHAIDRKTIVETLLGPIAQVQDNFVDPTSWAYNANVTTYPFDQAKAKQLLADAGWTPGSDGILVKEGKRFAFEALVIQAAYGAQVMEPIQANLKAVGIEMTIRNVPTFQEMGAAVTSADFVAAETNDGYEVYPDRRHRWLSTNVPPKGVNVARYKNPELDAVLNDAWEQPLQSDAQKADYFKMQEILARDLPWIPMYYPLMVQATSDRLCGTEAGSVYYVQTANKWWLAETGG